MTQRPIIPDASFLTQLMLALLAGLFLVGCQGAENDFSGYPTSGGPTTGPAAVLAFEAFFRGELNPAAKGTPPKQHEPLWKTSFPDARPIPLSSRLAHITPLHQQLWRRKTVLEHFGKMRNDDQVAALVFIKSEYCHTNGSRPCGVTTSAFECQSTPLLKHFKIYGAWIAANPYHESDEWIDWESRVKHEYKFEQGSGPTIIVLVPGSGQVIRIRARDLELELPFLTEHDGRTPKLEEFLQQVLADIPKTASDSKSCSATKPGNRVLDTPL